ncbi:unnamed protein product [Rotaria socialis]|nr:unnamed protein product [Rotaria socialis]CAF3323022.1 unnamed protein product [Rotaria socialis]CAF4515748.1 unnamed protein product [Rotaria socialis]CAF4545435.1 unnamed protein product [Rotaria socialis]CAF4571701.1 unnamed protein product [Rotaria socialis]
MSQGDIKQASSKTNTAAHRKIWTQSAFSTSLRDRPVVFNSQHIDDIGRKYSMNTNERRRLRIDEGSLLMTSDPDSIFYRHLREELQNTSSTATRLVDEKEKLKLFEQYGPELVEFIKDRGGNLKSKFDKVFII